MSQINLFLGGRYLGLIMIWSYLHSMLRLLKVMISLNAKAHKYSIYKLWWYLIDQTTCNSGWVAHLLIDLSFSKNLFFIPFDDKIFTTTDYILLGRVKDSRALHKMMANDMVL